MNCNFKDKLGSATRLWCPLKLAWAITSHKSQSMTLPSVACHFQSMNFDLGLKYVAASRVRKSTDFHLLEPVMDWELKPGNRLRHIDTVNEWERLVALAATCKQNDQAQQWWKDLCK